MVSVLRSRVNLTSRLARFLAATVTLRVSEVYPALLTVTLCTPGLIESMFCGVTPITALSSWTCAPSGDEVIVNAPSAGTAGAAGRAGGAERGCFTACSSSGTSSTCRDAPAAGGVLAVAGCSVGTCTCTCDGGAVCDAAKLATRRFEAETLM